MSAVVKNFSVSYAIDINRTGERSSHFVSATIELQEPVSVEDLPAAQLEAGYKVAVATIYDALMRGSMDQSQANDRIQIMKDNYAQLKAAKEKKK